MPAQGSLKDILDGHQRRLATDLTSRRQVIGHAGTLGSVTEDRWLRLLQRHLPLRYQADRAFVIDSRGQCSDQIDIVIFDQQYSPLIDNDGGNKFIPAESVYAVLEVKQELSRKYIRYAGEKAATVRRLHRTSVQFPWAKGTMDARPLPPILAGVLALESTWTPPFGPALAKVLSGLASDQKLQIGCALSHGAFVAEYSGKGVASIQASTPDQALVEFFFRLLRGLQLLATAPAMDFEAYLRGASAPAKKPTKRGRR